MKTECSVTQLEFQGLGRRKVLGAFDGGHMSSDGGAVLLRELDARLGITRAMASCFTDHRNAELIEHSVLELVRQRVYGIALGYEDLNDHDDLKRDPLLALALEKHDLSGKARHRKADAGKLLASSSTLNRLELTDSSADESCRYKKIVHHPEQLEDFFVDVFLDSFSHAPAEIVLDFDATDDRLHGNQEGRFYHGYYGAYCYLPLYVTCGDHLLVAKLRTSDRDGADGSSEVLAELVKRIRERWPEVKIIVRGDSGFMRDGFASWCESHGVYYLLGLAKNKRLLKKIGKELGQAHARHLETGVAARVFTHFQYRTAKSWSRARRVIAKAEQLNKKSNPRFIVTNLPQAYATPDVLYEKHYCVRGEMENKIKEQQLDLFADRTSTHDFKANQLRVWFSAAAYLLTSGLRRIALKNTRLAKATSGSIRLKLFKIAAQIKITVRRITIHFANACPYREEFQHAWNALQNYPLKT